MIRVTGIDKLIKNLKGAGKRFERSIERGLIKGGQYLQAESQKIVPVQIGNLRGSAFTRKIGYLHVVVGYTAAYAAFVHENLGATHGQEFNIKHAAEIADRPRRSAWRRARGRKDDKITDPYFARGPDEQAKFLERPARERRAEILAIVGREAKRI